MPPEPPTTSTTEMNWGSPPPEPPAAPKRAVVHRYYPWVLSALTLGYAALFTPQLLAGWGYAAILLSSVVLTVLYFVFPFGALGAMAGARQVGFIVRKIGLGPLLLLRANAGTRRRFERGWSLLTTQVAFDDMPVERLRSGMPAVLRGMLVANLLRGLPIVALFVIVANRTNNDAASFYLYFGASFFGMLTLISALPFVQTLKMLRAGRPDADAIVGQWAVAGAISSGRRPRDWDCQVVAMLERLPDTTINAVAPYSQVYFHYLDTGDFERASWFLNKASAIVEGNPRLRGKLVLPDLAYFTARHLNDPVEARRWLDNRRALMLDGHTRDRVATAVLIAEGRYEEARDAARSGLASAERSFNPGLAVMDADLIREMLAEIDTLEAAPSHRTLSAW